MPTVRELEKWLDKRILKELSEPWDNDGLQVCADLDTPITRAIAALDVTSGALNLAQTVGAQIIVTHHPIIFEPLRRVTAELPAARLILQAAARGVSLFACHTRLDAMEGGVNDCLCALLGLRDTFSFGGGCGRIGSLESPVESAAFAAAVGHALDTNNVSGVCPRAYVRRVAVLGGSGKSFFADAVSAGADTFLTGEVSHSTLLDARELGINLICATHYCTEAVVIPVIARVIKEGFGDIEVFEYYEKEVFKDVNLIGN